MSKLVAPHGGKGLVCCLLEGAELEAEIKKAEGLKKARHFRPRKRRPYHDGYRWLLPTERFHGQKRLEERM
jgi:hypothetical protein